MKFHPKAVLMMIILLLLFGCSSQTASEQRASMVERDKEMIHFGVAWPFESANDLFWEGVELAVEEINASGGVLNRQINLIQQDDQATVTNGLEIAQDFADNHQVSAVIGHRNSFVSIPASAIYEKAGIVMLSPASSSPKLTEVENQFIFRNITSDRMLAEELADYAFQNGHKKMVIIYDDDAYGEGLANAFEKQASKIGIDIVDRLSYFSGTSELEHYKFKWETLQYDGIFIAKSNPAGAQLVKDLRAANIELPLYAGNAMDSSELWDLSNELLENITVGSFFNPESTREKVTNFIDAFENKYHKAPSQYSAQGYDAVYILVEAIQIAQSIVPEQIASSLRTMVEWEGVAGFHTFAANGDDIGPLFVIKEIYQGEVQYITSETTEVSNSN